MGARINVPGLAVLVTTAALALAACSASADTPHVASLGNSGGQSGGSTTTAAAPKGDPTKLVDEWAACERSHGDPDQADPVINVHDVIDITLSHASESAAEVRGLTGACSQYLAAAQSDLRAANPAPAPPDQSAVLKYVACMRANGVPNYPYPQGDKTDFEGTGVDPNSPLVQSASNVCGKKVGAPGWWISGTGPPGDISVQTVEVPSGGPPPASMPGTGAAGNGGAGASA